MKGGKKKKSSNASKRLPDHSSFEPTGLAVDDEFTLKMKVLISGYYLNSKYSDLCIICGSESFPAHQNIVCAQSKYFEVACGGPFEERNGEIRLDKQDPALVRKMLEFLYTGDYTYETQTHSNLNLQLVPQPEELLDSQAQSCPANARTGPSRFHAQMYAQGDYFQIHDLKTKAKQYFQNSFMKSPTRESFASAIIEVYSSTRDNDRGLRDLVIQMTRDNLATLRTQGNPILDNSLLEIVPDFMSEICFSVLDKCAERDTRYGYY